MESSVYISSEKIEVLGYSRTGRKVTVKEFVTAALPEGTMINGKIFDEAALIDCLVLLKQQNPKLLKRVSLAVDGSSLLIKRLVVPKLSNKHYYKLLADEFNDNVIDPSDLVRDYSPLSTRGKNNGKNKGKAILACASDKALIESYLRVFKTAGIKLSSIKIGVQAILSYIDASQELRDTTFVLNVVDGVTMLSMIFENGSNVFMTRTRLYGDENEELAQNIIENLSGLIQFNKSEQFSEIRNSYYLGLTETDIEYMRGINPHTDVSLEAVDLFEKARNGSKLEKDAHFAYLNAMFDNTGIDLIRSNILRQKLNRNSKPRKPLPFLLALLVLVLAVAAIKGYEQLRTLNNELDALHEYLNDGYITAKSAELDSIIAETEKYGSIGRELRQKKTEDGEKRAISSSIFDLITSTYAERVRITRVEYTESTGTVQVSAIAETETDSSEYIYELGKSDYIDAIHYTGYSYTGNDLYSFSIMITLSGEDTE